MLEFVLSTIFWTLAIYGLFEVIKNIIYISRFTKFKSDGIYVIIAVKNQEEKEIKIERKNISQIKTQIGKILENLVQLKITRLILQH